MQGFKTSVYLAKSRYLKADEVAPAREAIARGKRLAKVERRLAVVVQQIDALAQQAAELGLVVPFYFLFLVA